MTIRLAAGAKTYARDTIPHIERYPGGQIAPTPKQVDFQPGELLGCVSGELGLRKYLESQGHKLVVTSDKDGPRYLVPILGILGSASRAPPGPGQQA
jgi:hypothetical protein